MRILLRYFFCILSHIFFIFFCPYAYSDSLIINEIMFNPNGNENAREYVEIMNLSDVPVSLEGCRIGQGDSFDTISQKHGSWIVPPDGYALIIDPDYFSAGEPYLGIPDSISQFTVQDKAIGSGGLLNTNPRPVYLLSARGDTLSAINYSSKCPPGHSWERMLPQGSDESGNFLPSRDIDGSPGRINSVTPPSVNPSLAEDCIRFGTVQPKPGEGFDFYISYRNSGLKPLSGITVIARIRPDIPMGSVSFPGEVIPGERSRDEILHFPALPGGSLQIEAVINCCDSMNRVSDDTLRVDLDVPVPEGTVIINEIMPAPTEGPEWLEVLNTGTFPVSLHGWRITDRTGKLSEEIGQFVFLRSGEYAVISEIPSFPAVPAGSLLLSVKTFPSLNNDGDTVVLLDYSGEAADSVSYPSSTTGLSLELISPRIRETISGWDKSTDPSGSTPGCRNSIFFDKDSGETEEKGAVLLIEPNPFLEKTSITYRLPFPLARVRMTVYDRRGRKIASFRDASESGYTWTGTWDGKSKGEKLPAGPYILNLEALNKTTGKMTVLRKIIVIGSKL
jgi:hypothetical protein